MNEATCVVELSGHAQAYNPLIVTPRIWSHLTFSSMFMNIFTVWLLLRTTDCVIVTFPIGAGTVCQYCNILPIYQLNIHIDMSYLNINILFQCISQLLSAYLAHVQSQFCLPVVNYLEWKCTVVWVCFTYALALAWYQSHLLPYTSILYRQYGIQNNQYAGM